jgi:hypothetical protein
MKDRVMKKNVDCLHTPSDGSGTQAGSFVVDADIRSDKTHQHSVINNNFRYGRVNSIDSKGKSLEFLHTTCSKCMGYVHDKNEAKQYRCTHSVLRDSRKYRSPIRKGTRCPNILKNKLVLDCTDQYVTSEKGADDHLCCSDSYGEYNGSDITSITNTESALEGASNDSTSIDYSVAAIVKEFKTVSPVSSFDDSFSESSDIVQNIPNYELDFSVILQDVRTEVQKVADINSSNEDSTQFVSDARGTSTPFATCEDGLSTVRPRAKEIDTFDSEELTYSCHTDGQNLCEERVNDVGAEAMIIHDSLEEASAYSTVPLPGTAQFF